MCFRPRVPCPLPLPQNFEPTNPTLELRTRSYMQEERQACSYRVWHSSELVLTARSPRSPASDLSRLQEQQNAWPSLCLSWGYEEQQIATFTKCLAKYALRRIKVKQARRGGANLYVDLKLYSQTLERDRGRLQIHFCLSLSSTWRSSKAISITLLHIGLLMSRFPILRVKIFFTGFLRLPSSKLYKENQIKTKINF